MNKLLRLIRIGSNKEVKGHWYFSRLMPHPKMFSKVSKSGRASKYDPY